MTLHISLIEALLSLVPVALLLGSLLLLDSFRLVGAGAVALTLAGGAGAAVVSLFAAGFVMDGLHLEFAAYSRFGAPLLEEAIKALAVLALFRLGRIGFLVDAAILGLCVGAGFSMLENIYYAFVFPDANAMVWAVRGLGTAIMHAGATALFALAAQMMREHDETPSLLDYGPGLLVASSVHLVFNQFTAYPIESAAGTILLLPMGLLLMFDRSEHQMHDCLVEEYDSHEKLLADIRSGRFEDSHAGRIIGVWAARRDPALAASVFEYILLHTELVLAAEARLLAREKGEAVAARVDRGAFAHLHLLERRMGKASLMTLQPHLKFSRRELFELHQLEAQAAD